MKRFFTLLFLIILGAGAFAQNNQKGDSRSSNQNAVIRIEGPIPNGWVKGDNDASSGSSAQVIANENVSFTTTSDGIYININSGTNRIKLFALTGQLLLNGVLTQGHFFIPAKTGIYFLKVNTKSFKVICK